MLGTLIKNYRKREKIGIVELAGQIGVSAATLSRLENGKEVDLKTHFKIERWLYGKPI